MDQAYPDITPEVKQRLQNQGLVQYKPHPVPDILNPHKKTCNKNF